MVGNLLSSYNLSTIFRGHMESESISKEQIEYSNLAALHRNLQIELQLYKFFLTKHSKTLKVKDLPKKFSLNNRNHFCYTRLINKTSIIVSPVVWIEEGILKKFTKYPSYINKISIKNYPTFLLVNENQVPFYLLSKYGGRRKVEFDIFKLPKLIQKELNKNSNKIKKEIRKKEKNKI